ncbi:MAG: HRDC domain-containing protein [Terrimicrobiaceae bacterium]|nr:HRDC domain-containing protein [Terrimicrobiaceae bacterium]
MISTPSALAELLDRISRSPALAFDTEADSLHSYQEKICLIQIGTEEEAWLVDPLCGLDLKPLWEALGTKRLVLHGADYDLRLLHREHGFAPPDVLDTMIGARLCGFAELGLAALVEKHFGVRLSKSSQKANWGIRPLPAKMVDYALNDIRYLLPLGRIIEARLRELGRWEWFVESRDRMAAAAREARARNDETAWRISGSSSLSPRAQSVLRVLWQWRDSEARSWNRPAFHVMGNREMLEIAAKAAAGEPYEVPRMPAGRKKNFEVLLALALQIPPAEWPEKKPPSGRRLPREAGERLAALRKTRDEAAKQAGLDPSIIASRQALEETAANPSSPALMAWQRKLLGLPPLDPPAP